MALQDLTLNPAQTRTYTYDALQRLKTGGTTIAPETYEYDSVGNRTLSFLSTLHTHDDANRLLEDDQFTYTYDANGNVETRTDKTTTDVTTYTWDAQDQLIQIDFPDATSATYKYDGLGRRIEKNLNGSITRYVYDGQDILLAYDGTNTFVSRYSHGGQTDQPLAVQRAGVGFFYYQTDNQGSITHLTDSSGLIANTYQYDSYGRPLTLSETVPQPFRYTGREFDAESGLYYYRARYYDPNTGRFLSEDPSGNIFRDLSLYRYTFNNPINFRDPTGEYGTNDCSYYNQSCGEDPDSFYYCELAPAACEEFPKEDDPDPTRDDDVEPVLRCTRKCLQECDAGQSFPNNTCPRTDDENRRDPVRCHANCIVECTFGKTGG